MPGENQGPAGSSAVGEPAFLTVGRVRRTHGLKGEVLVDLLTDFPERLRTGTSLFAGDRHKPLTVRSMRTHPRGMLLAFENVDSLEAASQLKDCLLYVSAFDQPLLAKGEYYHHQLLGLRVFDEHKGYLGELSEIIVTGANDVYVISDPGGKEILLPAILEVIQNVDLVRGEMKVHLLPGLLDEPG